jgi:L-alanine-DL-glutamate epimerase-like enolase superfamily enzyme
MRDPAPGEAGSLDPSTAADERSLTLSVAASELPLLKPFRVASFSISTAATVVATLRYGAYVGYGEAAPLKRYGDSVDSVLAFYDTYALPEDASPFATQQILDGVPAVARCALDLALHDLQGHLLGASLKQLLGLEGLTSPPTSVTIPIGDITSVVARARELSDVPVLKVKVGAGGDGSDVALIEAIRSVYAGTVRIDANEGWTPEQAVAILRELERFGIELCEQPIPAGSPEQLRWVSDRSPIPIVVDEDALEAADLAPLIGCAYGVNVKLSKCGGIRAALAMIATARALGFRVMLGSMSESSILATAGAHLGPLVDWVDVDGPLFLKSDPYVGVSYKNGRLVLPLGPGLGVVPRPAAPGKL